MTVNDLISELQKHDKGMEVRAGTGNNIIVRVEAKPHADRPDWNMVSIGIRQPPPPGTETPIQPLAQPAKPQPLPQPPKPTRR